MENLPYFVMGGCALLALITPLIGGGTYWLVPAVMWPLVFIFFLFDRRLKSRESREERMAMDLDQD